MPLLFAATLFVSAFLLFLVQPMIGKMVLPLLGGTPAVWNTCMVFFQAALLAGYAYTHSVSTGLRVRRQLVLQCALLTLPFLFLPFAVGSWEPPTESNPVFSMLGLLALMVGVPFFVVATSAPLLQKWFAATGHPTAKDPYFLYGASNLGSMLALLAYPILVEPAFAVATQSWLWAGAYMLFISLALACVVAVWLAPPVVELSGAAVTPGPAEPVPPAPDANPIRPASRSWRGRRSVQAVVAAPAVKAGAPAEVTLLRRLRWIGLAAVPSSLMLGVTTYLTTDIAAIPLFWVIPLALYLLSFILVFMRWPVEWTGLPHRIVVALQPLSLVLLALFNLVDVTPPTSLAFVVNLGAFFLTALLCHGELARDRPSTRHLTEYYLCMSLGGVLGGLLNGLVAPMVFNRLVEYTLVLALSCFLRPPVSVFAALVGRKADKPEKSTLEDYVLDLGYAVCVGLLTFALIKIAVARNFWGEQGTFYPHDKGSLHDTVAALFKDAGLARSSAWAVAAWVSVAVVAGIPLGVCLVFSGRALRCGLCAFAFFLANGLYAVANDDSLFVHRNFFGVIRVRPEVDDGKIVQHTLIHGGIDHGRQYVSGPKRYLPITYFHPSGPIGQIFSAFKEQAQAPPYGVIGLGIGTLASYGRPGQECHFYEIDPAVKRLSLPPPGEQAYFFYLQDALDKGVKLEVRLGDGRLKLKETSKDGHYQILVVDAFSSDAIPVHLLTLEAVDLYRKKLADGGVLIFNITNRYVDLKQPLANVAAKLGLRCYYGGDYAGNVPDKFAADWVVMVKPRTDRRAIAAEAMHLFGAVGGKGPAAVPWATLARAGEFDLPPLLLKLDLDNKWELLEADAARVWTDDYSNLWSVMNL